MLKTFNLKQALDQAGLASTPLSIAKRQPLFRSGDRVRRMFYVLEGRLNMIRTLENGQELVVQRAGPGDLLAEASLFADRYHCDAVGETAARCAAYDKQAVIDALHNPEISMSVLRIYSQEIRNLRSQIELRNIKRADDRVAAFLSMLPRDRGGWCDPNHAWKDIARTIGLTHEACYRALAALVREKRLEKSGGRYRLK